MSIIKRSTIRKVEDILRDYPKLDKYIEQLEDEIRYPVGQTDDNVGGGKTNYPDHDGPLRTLITIDEDRRIRALTKQRDVIESLLQDCGEETGTIIKELYFKRHPEFTVDGLIENNLIYVSRSTAFKLRIDFIKKVAEKLGFYDLY